MIRPTLYALALASAMTYCAHWGYTTAARLAARVGVTEAVVHYRCDR